MSTSPAKRVVAVCLATLMFVVSLPVVAIADTVRSAHQLRQGIFIYPEVYCAENALVVFRCHMYRSNGKDNERNKSCQVLEASTLQSFEKIQQSI